MDWFDEQIRNRIRRDDDAFSGAITGMAGVVLGKRLTKALSDDRKLTKSAIDEILRYYRAKPAELPESVRDINDQLEYLLRPTGIMRRRVNLTGAWYKDAVGAMIGSFQDGGPVALIPGAFAGYKFLNPKTGKRARVNGKTARLLNTEAICFYRPLPAKKIGIRDLLVYIVKSFTGSGLARAALIMLFSTLVGLLMPFLNGVLYGQVMASGSMRLFIAVFGAIVSVSLSKLLIETAQSLTVAAIGEKVNVQLQAAGMMRLLSLPASFFKEHASGDLSARMGYLENICTILMQFAFTAGLTSVFSLAYIPQMIGYGPALVIPALVQILSMLVFSAMTLFVQLGVSRKTMELDAKEEGVNYALISGIQKIKLAGAEKRAFVKWVSTYRRVAKLKYDPPMILKLSKVLINAMTVYYVIIEYITIRAGMPISDLIAFGTAYGMVVGAFVALINAVESIAQIQPMLEMLRPILETVPEISENKRVVTRLSGGVELNNLSFRYESDGPQIINDLTLRIKPGQYLSIVGKTGCGKSTLMRLLLGFETPQKGAIYYDGKDISGLDLQSLRRNIGSVTQNGKLFQGDIFSNITVCAPHLSLSDAWEAAELAGIAEDIRRMPMGMRTLIAEGGGGISGGQRQRLLIARAVAPKPRILIFDEATAALDNITQRRVCEALDKLKCTRIVIAHRLSTIRSCDRIVVLEDGGIVEDGSYDELLQKNGAFAALVARQMLDEAESAG